MSTYGDYIQRLFQMDHVLSPLTSSQLPLSSVR